MTTTCWKRTTGVADVGHRRSAVSSEPRVLTDQPSPRLALLALGHRAQGPAVEVPSSQYGQCAVGVLRRDDGHHADAHVEGLLHLGALDLSALCDHAENRCGSPCSAIHVGTQPV